MIYFVVALGGIIGSLLRYFLSSYFKKYHMGTLVVNILGSFLLGYTSHIKGNTTLLIFLQSGIVGSFTDFARFILDEFSLIVKNREIEGILYLFLNIILSYIAYIMGVIF